MVEKKDMKRCPFCGSPADLYRVGSRRHTHNRGNKYRVRCMMRECVAYTIMSYYDSPEEAAAAWNRRAEG